jgi:hypothetical protein
VARPGGSARKRHAGTWLFGAPGASWAGASWAWAAGCAVVAGCGGGSPLLHGAHALRPGDVAIGAGFSGTFSTGDLGAPVPRALSSPPDANTVGSLPSAAGGTALVAAVAPGVAPWVSARFGLPASNEAGLAYTGRGFRLDARHVLNSDRVAFSIGAGATWLLPVSAEPADPQVGAAHLAAPSVGFDVPFLVGWRSTAGIVSLWGGARAGYEHLEGDVTLLTPRGTLEGSLSANRWYAGGIVGLGLGFRHLHGNLELDASYQDVRGTGMGYAFGAKGVTLTPAAALIATF